MTVLGKIPVSYVHLKTMTFLGMVSYIVGVIYQTRFQYMIVNVHWQVMYMTFSVYGLVG